MTAAPQLAGHINRTIDGPMWHGPALAELLADVSYEAAAARPIPGAHSIWQLVRHLTAWAEIALAPYRLKLQRALDSTMGRS